MTYVKPTDALACLLSRRSTMIGCDIFKTEWSIEEAGVYVDALTQAGFQDNAVEGIGFVAPLLAQQLLVGRQEPLIQLDVFGFMPDMEGNILPLTATGQRSRFFLPPCWCVRCCCCWWCRSGRRPEDGLRVCCAAQVGSGQGVFS